ncbi:MAG: hypothetical protein AAF429_09175 [Pseudomonadota bacterium]
MPVNEFDLDEFLKRAEEFGPKSPFKPNPQYISQTGQQSFLAALFQVQLATLKELRELRKELSKDVEE